MNLHWVRSRNLFCGRGDLIIGSHSGSGNSYAERPPERTKMGARAAPKRAPVCAAGADLEFVHFCASIRGEALSGKFQIRVNRCFWGLNRCFVHQSVRPEIFVSTLGMMHIRIMGLSQRISAEGADHISLGQRPRR